MLLAAFLTAPKIYDKFKTVKHISKGKLHGTLAILKNGYLTLNMSPRIF